MGFAFACNTLCCHFNLHIKNGSLHLITLSYCQGWRAALGFQIGQRGPLFSKGKDSIQIQGHEDRLYCFLLLWQSLIFRAIWLRMLLVSLPQACGWWDLWKCPFHIQNSPMVSPDTLGIKFSLDHGPPGPTRFGSWPPLCSLCHTVLVGSSPATVARVSSDMPSSLPLWLYSLPGTLFPSYQHVYPSLSSIYSIFTSSPYLSLTLLPLHPSQALFSSSRQLSITLPVWWLDLLSIFPH